MFSFYWSTNYLFAGCCPASLIRRDSGIGCAHVRRTDAHPIESLPFSFIADTGCGLPAANLFFRRSALSLMENAPPCHIEVRNRWSPELWSPTGGRCFRFRQFCVNILGDGDGTSAQDQAAALAPGAGVAQRAGAAVTGSSDATARCGIRLRRDSDVAAIRIKRAPTCTARSPSRQQLVAVTSNLAEPGRLVARAR